MPINPWILKLSWVVETEKKLFFLSLNPDWPLNLLCFLPGYRMVVYPPSFRTWQHPPPTSQQPGRNSRLQAPVNKKEIKNCQKCDSWTYIHNNNTWRLCEMCCEHSLPLVRGTRACRRMFWSTFPNRCPPCRDRSRQSWCGRQSRAEDSPAWDPCNKRDMTKMNQLIDWLIGIER